MMIKVVLVDDEPKALQGLQWELENFCPNVVVVGTFDKPQLALQFLKENDDIDGLFLDIEMPGMDGFQLLDQIPNRQFSVIITTAYDQYGINAIKERALDYLLKPIDSDDLSEAVKKLEEQISNSTVKDKFEQTLMDIVSKTNSSTKKIGINSDGKIIFLMPEEIILCEADGNYTKVYLEDNKTIFVTQTLKKIEEKLSGDEFFRIHNSFIINLTKVKEYLKTESYIVLSNNKTVPVARQRKSIFLDMF
ncbi:two component transcriptional regulator, LytTR family [Spirosomataceae bacterium TFI 002]|nr:two component transcriptional regulator, LytTR family [Spirosomataceae bacterium TFI 002]